MEKIALVSGGARGIGRAAAEIFIEQGLRSLFLTETVKNLTRLASKLLVLCLSIMMFLMKNL